MKIKLKENPIFKSDKDKETYNLIKQAIADEITFKKEVLGFKQFEIILQTNDDLEDDLIVSGDLLPYIYSDQLFKGWSIRYYLLDILED